MASALKTLVSRILRVEAKADPTLGLSEFFGSPVTASGQSVSPATALKCPAVSVAVQSIAGTIGSLPAKIFRGDLGGKAVDKDHPAYALVHDDANEWTSAAALRKQLTTDALLHGNGFAFANRVNGRVVEFDRLDPKSIQIEISEETGEPFYKSISTPPRTFTLREILHVPAPLSFDGISGQAPIALAREAIGLSLTLEAHAARLFGRGGRPSGVVSFDGKVGEVTLKQMSADWHAAHGGEYSGKTAFLQDGGKFIPITFNSVDSQFEQMRRFQIDEIARAFSIPPTMLFELSRGTWANTEEMRRQFYTLTLLPWLRIWEAAYRRVLLSPVERRTHSIEFVVDDFLRADTAARATALSQFRSMGAMTANEVRALENLPPLPGGDVLQNPFTTSGKSEPPKDLAA